MTKSKAAEKTSPITSHKPIMVSIQINSSATATFTILYCTLQPPDYLFPHLTLLELFTVRKNNCHLEMKSVI